MLTLHSTPSVFDYLNRHDGQTHDEFYNAARMLAEPEQEIDSGAYDYFLGVLPPMFWQGATFCVPEAIMNAPDGRVLLSSFRQAGSGPTARYFHSYVAIDAATYHRAL